MRSTADGDELGAVVVAFPDEIKLGIIRHVSHVVGAHEDDVEGWAGLEGVLHYAFDDVSVFDSSSSSLPIWGNVTTGCRNAAPKGRTVG